MLFSRLRIDPRIARFIGLFILFALGMTWFVNVEWIDNHMVQPYVEFITRLSAALLGYLGTPVESGGSTLSWGIHAVQVRRGCDGIEAAILLLSALLAYPASWKRRLIGCCQGFSLIFVINLVRIIGLCLLLFYGSQGIFEFFHLYVSQFAIVALTMVFWIYWAGRQAQPHRA